MAAKSKREWSWWNIYVIFLVSLCQMAFGYPSSIISVTLASPAFLEYMGLIDNKNADALIGAMSGVFQAGAAINIFIVSWIADRYGRKAAIWELSILSLFGGALLCGSQNVAMFIAARVFAGAGSWGFMGVISLYTAELAPPALRGLLVGLNGLSIAFAYAFAAYMGLAFYYVEDPVAQWRAPLGIALVFPIIAITVTFLVPESPRYLLMQGRVSEAKEVVFKLHSIKGDANQDFAQSEFYQMSKQAEYDKKLEPGWIEIFRNPSYRKRVVMGASFAVIGQSTGSLVLNNYGPTIYSRLGYDTEKQLFFQCGWLSLGVVASLIGAFFVDSVGRKPMMMFGVLGSCVGLILEAAMVSSFADTTNVAGLRMGVAATYLWLVAYAIGVDLCGVVFFSEIFPNHLRSKGVAICIGTISLIDLVYLEVTATAFTNIGWKFYLVFIIISGLGAIWIYFYIPETKGVPLEEMAKLFGDNVAVYMEDVQVNCETHKVIVADQKEPAGGTVQETEVVT